MACGVVLFAFSVSFTELLKRLINRRNFFTNEAIEDSILIAVEMPCGESEAQTHLRNNFIINCVLSNHHFKRCFICVLRAKEVPLPKWLAYASNLYSITWNSVISKSNDFIPEIIVLRDETKLKHLILTEKIEKIFAEYSKMMCDFSSVDTSELAREIDMGFEENEVILIEEDQCSKISRYMFDFIAVGGSFDHLHNGHRKLLNAAAVLCQKQLTIGISGKSLLINKRHAELIDSFNMRKRKVLEFLAYVNSDLDINAVRIEDPYGPTITDSSLEAIVVSSETILGGFKINSLRSQKGWNRLVILLIQRHDSASLSSTYLRDKIFHSTQY